MPVSYPVHQSLSLVSSEIFLFLLGPEVVFVLLRSTKTIYFAKASNFYYVRSVGSNNIDVAVASNGVGHWVMVVHILADHRSALRER